MTVRSSAWFGARCRLVYILLISTVRRRARRDERSAAPHLRRGRFFLYVPAEQLIDEVRICLESGLLILAFYQFWALLSIKLYKIVDSISCFPRNTMKYELRITLEFWRT